jgi:hypothetical protein
VSRNFREKCLTGALFLDVAKAFDTVLVDGLLYKLAVLNFPSYLFKTVSPYMSNWKFEPSFQTATSTSCMRAGVGQGGIISPVLFTLYINDMPSPSCHTDLALYADDNSFKATSSQPPLLVKYLVPCLSDLRAVAE